MALPFTHEQFEKATREVFMAHDHYCVIHKRQTDNLWVVAIDGEECRAAADKATAMKYALKQYGYRQELIEKHQQGE